MNNLLVSSPFILFGAIVLIYIVLAMGGGRTRSGSTKSLSGSLSKILLGSSGKKSSKKSSKGSSKGSSRGNKYMGFTMTQILIGAAVVGGIYYYSRNNIEAFGDLTCSNICDMCEGNDAGKGIRCMREGSDITQTALGINDKLTCAKDGGIVGKDGICGECSQSGSNQLESDLTLGFLGQNHILKQCQEAGGEFQIVEENKSIQMKKPLRQRTAHATATGGKYEPALHDVGDAAPEEGTASKRFADISAEAKAPEEAEPKVRHHRAGGAGHGGGGQYAPGGPPVAAHAGFQYAK